MWKVIYIAPGTKQAERLREVLEREGLLVNLRPVGNSEAGGPVEVLVPQLEAAEGHEILSRVLCNPPRRG